MLDYIKNIDQKQVIAAIAGALIQSTGLPQGVVDAGKLLYKFVVGH